MPTLGITDFAMLNYPYNTKDHAFGRTLLFSNSSLVFCTLESMASKELEPSLSLTYKVVGDQELRVDVFLPNRRTQEEQLKCPIGEHRAMPLPKTSHHR